MFSWYYMHSNKVKCLSILPHNGESPVAKLLMLSFMIPTNYSTRGLPELQEAIFVR